MSDNNTTNNLGYPDAQFPSAVTTDARPRIRVGTIIWGLILVAVAALYVGNAIFDLDAVDGWKVITWGALALGALLVVGGLIAAATRRNR
jgi:hypothetical protein